MQFTQQVVTQPFVGERREEERLKEVRSEEVEGYMVSLEKEDSLAWDATEMNVKKTMVSLGMLLMRLVRLNYH